MERRGGWHWRLVRQWYSHWLQAASGTHPKNARSPRRPWHTGEARVGLAMHPSIDARQDTRYCAPQDREAQASETQNARKCYGRMSIHMRTKHAKNDTKAIKMDTVSSKNVKNQYGFVLPILTLLLHAPLGASAKAVLWITWPRKASQTAPKMCFPENQNATYIKNGNRDSGIGNREQRTGIRESGMGNGKKHLAGGLARRGR